MSVADVVVKFFDYERHFYFIILSIFMLPHQTNACAEFSHNLKDYKSNNFLIANKRLRIACASKYLFRLPF
jgi:hypothetical protein